MVPPKYIKDYLSQFFGKKGKFSSNGQEFIMPSIFIEDDWKNHFSINTETGLWQDFKTGKSGNFIHFVAEVEGITYNKAEAKILFYEFEHPEEEETLTPTQEEIPLEVPEGLVPVNIHSHTSTDALVQKAWTFLYGRNLFNLEVEEEEPYYVSTEGKYKGRLIIPFKYDEEMYYFQARALEWETPKYLNPTGTYVKPSNILYPFSYEEDYVVVCEGPLDAISLQIQGINATATMGCKVSPIQASTLQEFGGKVIIGYDNDEAGSRGLEKFELLRKSYRMPEFYICTPPPTYNDWNEAHTQQQNLEEWVDNTASPYDYEYKLREGLNSL